MSPSWEGRGNPIDVWPAGAVHPALYNNRLDLILCPNLGAFLSVTE